MKKKLPRFVLLKNTEELSNVLVLETRPPFFIASPYCIAKKDSGRVEEMLAGIANERIRAVKVPGYTVFLMPYGTLSGENVSGAETIETMREMAEFYSRQALEVNKHKNRIYQEDMPDNIDEENGRRIRAAKIEGRKIYLEKK